MSNTIDILLAEDEEHIARLVAFKLKKEGYEVTIARNGEEAVNLLFAKPWKLLILDVMMPIRDGYEVLRVVRGSAPLAALPVLLLTARGQGDSPENQELHVDHYLKKPFDPAHLSQVVGSLVKKTEA